MVDKTTKMEGDNALLAKLNNVLDLVASGFVILIEIMLAFMLLSNTANILLRNLSGQSLLWVGPWTTTLMIWSVFLAFFVIYRRNMDIALTFLVERVSAGILRLLTALSGLVGIVVVSVVLVELPQILTRQRGIIDVVGIQRYWLSVPLLISSAFLVLHFLLQLVEIVVSRKAPSVQSGEEINQW